MKICRFLGNEDRIFAEFERKSAAGYSDQGASFTDWRYRKKEELVLWCKEMMLEMMVRGIEPNIVVQEFAKIPEIVQEGAKSFFFARVLSVALQGAALDLLEQWDLNDQ